MNKTSPLTALMVDSFSRLPAANRFTQLWTYRKPSLGVARECAALTKGTVVPQSGQPADAPVKVPYQSHGARLVNNLVSQLLLILFPPSVPFFKLDLRSLDIREMAKDIEISKGTNMYDALRETFVTLENLCTTHFETRGFREKLRMILLQLVVGGNSLYLSGDNDIELIPLDDWVVLRTSSGELLEIIYREVIPDPRFLQQGQDPVVYTRCFFQKKGMWTVDKYHGDAPEPYDSLMVKTEDLWVHVPTWELNPGEHYGRGPVEENLGDLRTLEDGMRIITDSASALAKVVFLVRPNGLTKAQDVASAENCEIISGDPNDVGVMQANKSYDFSGFLRHVEQIKQELDFVFMMPTVIRRDAERVTAEEIRRMATELEKSKGGTYSNLAKNLQGPLARLLLVDVLRNSPETLGAHVELSDLLPVVSTGLQGLGRTIELESTLMFLNDLQLVPGMEQLLDPHQLIYRLASLRGLELASVIKSAETLAEEAMEQQQAQLMAQQEQPPMAAPPMG